MSCQVGGDPMPRNFPCASSAQMSVRVFECLSVMVIFRRWYREGCLRAERLAPHAMLSAGIRGEERDPKLGCVFELSEWVNGCPESAAGPTVGLDPQIEMRRPRASFRGRA